MLETKARAWCEVDYDAIGHNLDEVKKLVGDTKIMGIVKANAYGHGDVACAKAMEEYGVDFFGVSSVDEAINLRNYGIKSDILVLGYTPSIHFNKLEQFNIIQSLVSLDYAKKLNEYAKKNNITLRAHAKVDTGMNRTGIIYQPQEKHMDEILEEYRLSNVKVEGIFSHFPVSDDLSQEAKDFTKEQIDLFEEVLANLKKAGIDPGLRHIQNSYGILNYYDLGYDYCRPGLLYMGVTSDDAIEIDSHPDFIPILSMKANISVVKWLDAGATISYGRTYTLDKPAKIATVSIGYADGIPRSISNTGWEVLVHGKRAKQIGRICMDQMMIDVTDIEDVKEGDVVTLVGKDGNERVTIDSMSRKAGTINNETLSAIASRMPRIAVKGGRR